jgi:arginyl-tRNA synthetase
MDNIKQKIVEELEKINIKVEANLLEVPPKKELGDYALPCFILAKELKKSPALIAKDISQNLISDNFQKIIANGPYVNFYIKNKTILQELKKINTLKEKYGSKNKINSTILIEGPSPNTNKPLHLGHVRNMSICKSLNNTLNFSGFHAKQINLNNDRGIHICKSMLAYKKFGSDDSPEKSKLKPDHFVAKYYVLFSKKAKENPDLEKEAQKMLKKWESGDEETINLWKKMNAWAFQGFKETYKTFNIKFDKQYYESEIFTKGKELIADGLKKGIFQKNKEGAVIIDLTDKGLDEKIVLRSDGTSVYITQDIYLAQKKYADFKYDQSIYVVGNEQEYHFQVLFEILKKLKLNAAKGCQHYSYGMIELPSGKMKSREGTTVDADNLINELKKLAKKEINKRHDLKEKELNKRAQKIAMSALLFYILKFDPKKNFVYDPKESISFEGETGPYCQYVYARIQSIIKKSKVNAEENLELLTQDQEKQLVKELTQFPHIIEKISQTYKISLIPRYLLSVCQEFNNYYIQHKIIQDNKKLESARLYLITAIAQVIKNGLSLLGIDVIDEM